VDLRVEVDYATIQLHWECYVNDLQFFKVFRNNSVGGWDLIDVVTPGAPVPLTLLYEDYDMANKRVEFKYKIHHVDNGGQEELNNNWVLFNDWVVTDYDILMDETFVLNGSLIVEDGGYLDVINTSFKMNGTGYSPGPKSIEVRYGGNLVIRDGGDNASSNDDSIINSSETMGHYEFIVLPGGRLEIYNSWIQNASSNYPEEEVNIYIESEDCKIINSTIVSSSRAVYLEYTQNCVIDGNTFINTSTEYQYGIVVYDSENLLIANNTFVNATLSNLEIDVSSDVRIFNNSMDTLNFQPSFNQTFGYTGLNVFESDNILIENNTFNGTNEAVFLFSSDGVTFSNNTISNSTINGVLAIDSDNLLINNNEINMLDTLSIYENTSSVAIALIDSNENIVVANNTIFGFKFGNPYTAGFYLENFEEFQISGNNLSASKYGFVVENDATPNFEDVQIANNTIHDLGSDGIGIQCYDMSGLMIAGNLIYNATTGFLQLLSDKIFYESNVMWNITTGYSLKFGSIAIIANGTIFGLPDYALYLNISSEVKIINPDFNQTRIHISDNTCEAQINWFMDIRIKDHYGNYIPDIFLRVRSVMGTILFEEVTDSNGCIQNLLILERRQFFDDNITFTPTSFEAEYANHTAYADVTINAKKSVELQLTNEAPQVFNIIIDPQTPKTTDTLTLNTAYVFLDAENDLERRTYYKWYKNSELITELDNATEVPSSYTSKGDLWYCRVTPCDNLDYGDPGNSLTVLIFNTKPSVSDSRLSPENPDGLEDLVVDYTYFDIDDDAELGTVFHWYARSGQTFDFRATTSLPTLDSSYTNKGEEWYVEIEPKDGEDTGDRNRSNIITIGNTVPWVEDVKVTPDKPSTSDEISVDYSFVDIDSDIEGNTTFKWMYYSDVGSRFLESPFENKSIQAQFLTKGEIWMCQVTPNDGFLAGTTVNSTIVTIGNTAPEIKNVQIQPSEPNTTDYLTVTYDYSDRDMDPEKESRFIWYKWEDDAYVKVGEVENLPYLYTKKGDNWICQVTPFDGTDYGKPIQSSTVTIGNSAPAVIDISITPQSPSTLDNIKASYQYSDDNFDTEQNTIIKWYKDGVYESEFDNLLEIEYTSTLKGQDWYFTVTPHDGNISGSTYTSLKVTVQNTPPVVLNPKIDPDTPVSSEDLNAVFDVYDPDGDTVVIKDIEWYKNGNLELQWNDSVPYSATEKGQSWKYIIRVTDGEDDSVANESSAITIKNSAPQILEFSPLQSYLELEESESLTFSINVDDPDDDILVIQWFLDKKIVDSDNSYSFQTDYDSSGTYAISVTVQDWGTGSIMVSNQWNISVINNNRKPTIQPKEPLDPNPVIDEDKSLKFLVTYSDQDKDDSVSIKWYLDGLEALSGESTYTYYPDSKSIGLHNVEVAVNDTYVNETYSWNVTVKDVLEISNEFMGLTWDQWSIVLEALVIGVTGLAAFIGFLKLRKRKGALQRYMTESEDIMKNWQDNPDKAEQKLVKLGEDSEKDFGEGKIEEFHYFLLDRQIKESLREIRQSKIKKSFESLPDHLRKEMNVMLEDGRITDKEYRTFVSVVSQSDGIPQEEKTELRRLMRSWKDVDAQEGGKKVVMKPLSVRRTQKRKKIEAAQLGWEDVSQSTEEDETLPVRKYSGLPPGVRMKVTGRKPLKMELDEEDIDFEDSDDDTWSEESDRDEEEV
jgi:parallel beta-helix repeat protein